MKNNILGLTVSDEVLIAQAQLLKQRTPVLYLTLSISILMLAMTHYATCPAWQCVYVPGGLILVIMIRLRWWLRMRGTPLDVAQARILRRKTIVLAGLLSLLILAWSASLYMNGQAHGWTGRITGAGHVAFFVGITVVSCISLLMHVRAAAILLTALVVLPFAGYLALSGHLIECAIALNLIVVAAATLYVTASVSLDFENMIATASDLRKVSAQNARLAAADPATGLPNRRSFWAELDRFCTAGRYPALMIIDLDGFKQVNDLYGHAAGDEVLIAIAERIRHLFPDTCCVARMGGDEFACLLPEDVVDRAEHLASSAIAACCRPVVLPAFTAHVGASVGIVLPETIGLEPAKAYERADYALYKAKRLGKGRVEVFTEDDRRLQHQELRLSHAMLSPAFISELSMAYQPVVAASDHRIMSFEALIRWQSAELGPVGPPQFIPIAERTDLIFEITNFAVRRALDDARHWPLHVRVKINLSVRDLMSTAQTKRLVDVVRTSGIAPERVAFEVTESIFADCLAQVRANLDLMRETGCAVAIDDFGVGYSSLNYIHALAPDVIKIDRCFIEEVVTNPASLRIVRTIVELARNVGATSVAEGVETAGQAELLAEIGCDELQGYFFARPLPVRDAGRLIDTLRDGAGGAPRRSTAA